MRSGGFFFYIAFFFLRSGVVYVVNVYLGFGIMVSDSVLTFLSTAYCQVVKYSAVLRDTLRDSCQLIIQNMIPVQDLLYLQI